MKKRAVIIQAIRRFFVDRGYVEVDTPARLPVLIPEAHNEPIESAGCYLQTSPEICMKRLLAESGCSRIFQICKCFRQDERGDRHLPEFTMLEWYRTECDYNSLMEECEDLVQELAGAAGNGSAFSFQGRSMDLAKPWERLSVAEAFRRFGSVSLEEALEKSIFDEILCRDVEPQLGNSGPVFLFDYPSELGALARKKAGDPAVAERFEIYMGGLELANGFSELTDADEQRRRFEKELVMISSRGRANAGMPEKFLTALACMPAAAGIALGIDRLAMILMDKPEIDGVVSFVPEDL